VSQPRQIHWQNGARDVGDTVADDEDLDVVNGLS
jgi:hypothetical protein